MFKTKQQTPTRADAVVAQMRTDIDIAIGACRSEKQHKNGSW